MKIASVLLGFAMLSVGCVPTLVVPDQSIPHQLSKECRTEILVTHPSGKMERQRATIPVGWWVASRELVEEE